MAALVKAFAAVVGKSVRTAQRMREQNHPDWLRYMGGQAVAAVAPGPRKPEQAAALAAVSPVISDREPAPDVVAEPDENLSTAEMMEKQHWLIWVQASRNWKRAMLENDDMKAAGFALLCIKARSEYIKARDARDLWDQSQRRVVPIAEFAALRAQFIVPLANLLRNLPSELSSMVNPNDPGYALAQSTEYLHTRLQPQIERLIDGLEDYVPVEPLAASLPS